MSTYRELLTLGREAFQKISDSPQLDAELLLAFVAGKNRVWLLSHDDDAAPEKTVAEFHSTVERRREGVPVAYIVGSKEFFGLDFYVSESVLIPRPETELLVEKSLEFVRQLPEPRRILDLGTGSGCIVINLALEINGERDEFVAVDLQLDALSVAKTNATAFEVEDRIDFVQSDWFSDLEQERFDCIVCNPPYVSRSATVSRDVLSEPHTALFSDDAGMADLKKIIYHSFGFLRDGGALFLECGVGQAEELVEYATRWESEVFTDLQGIERVLKFKKPGNR